MNVMNKISKLAVGSVIAAGATLCGAGLALADGYAAPRAAYVPPTDWSGLYFGVHSGYQWSSIDQTFATDTASVDYAAAVVGGHLGLQHQFGAIVLGIEGSFDSMYWEKDARAKSRLGFNCGTLDGVYGRDIDCTGRLNDILSV